MHRKLPGECNAGIISLSEKMDFHNNYQTTTQLLTHAKSLITGNCRIPFSIFPPFIHLHQPEVATSIYPLKNEETHYLIFEGLVMSWVVFAASATSGSCILVKLGLPTGVEAPSKPRPQELRSPPSPPRRFDDIPGQHPKCQARQNHLRMSGNDRKELRSKSILQQHIKE